MKLPLVFLVASITSVIAEIITNNSLPTCEVVAHDGYPCEKYHVITEDSYTLELHRISAPGRPVVFLMHGFLCSSFDWIVLGIGKALAYLLFDAGYDVWMGNARGNTYSRNMDNMTFSQIIKYWNYSWHEIGYFDLPAMIDFILKMTGLKQLCYIGHSQGTTVFFVLMTTRPEYNAKICYMFALAPIAYTEHATSPIARFATLTTAVSLAPGIQFLPHNTMIALLASIYCKDGAPTQQVCSSLILFILGYEKAQHNDSLLPDILGHFPAGGSDGVFKHYGQQKLSGHFRQYDYGWLGNWIKYGSSSPPNYDLSLVTAPVYMFSGAGDTLADETDVDRLLRELPNTTVLHKVNDPQWSHLDFIWGNDAKTYVYNLLIKVLKAVCNKSMPTSTSIIP